ncbi:hypothetical protein L873DRAFT_1664410, partial [Choiromyces venosus 120613-1]
IIIMQDECTFNSNDGRDFIWVNEDHHPLPKKGRGQGLHVLELLTPIRTSGDGTCEILKSGGDVWYHGEKLLDQIRNKVILGFEAEF